MSELQKCNSCGKDMKFCNKCKVCNEDICDICFCTFYYGCLYLCKKHYGTCVVCHTKTRLYTCMYNGISYCGNCSYMYPKNKYSVWIPEVHCQVQDCGNYTYGRKVNTIMNMKYVPEYTEYYLCENHNNYKCSTCDAYYPPLTDRPNGNCTSCFYNLKEKLILLFLCLRNKNIPASKDIRNIIIQKLL